MIIGKRVIFRENSFESLRGRNCEKLGVEFVSDQKEANISSQRLGIGIGQVLNIVCTENRWNVSEATIFFKIFSVLWKDLAYRESDCVCFKKTT